MTEHQDRQDRRLDPAEARDDECQEKRKLPHRPSSWRIASRNRSPPYGLERAHSARREGSRRRSRRWWRKSNSGPPA